MILDHSFYEKVHEVISEVSKKNLLQIEGSTLSGKTTFISDLNKKLRQKKLVVLIIEEAAAQVLRKNQQLFRQLVMCDRRSKDWKKAKTTLQQEVLITQVESLEYYAENDNFDIALMDRGGASTAYHMLPFIPDERKVLVEDICKELSKIARLTLFLSPIISLNNYEPSRCNGALRYQKTFREINLEYKGIKFYLNKWKLNFIEISSFRRRARIEAGLRCIFDLLDS